MDALLSIKRGVGVGGGGAVVGPLRHRFDTQSGSFHVYRGRSGVKSGQFASCNSERLYSQIKHQELSDVSNSIYKHRFRS